MLSNVSNLEYIQNIVVKSSDWTKEDINLLFGDEEVYFTNTLEIPILMKEIGAFDSTSQARKANRVGLISKGFTFEYKANKTRKIWIWNPQ